MPVGRFSNTRTFSIRHSTVFLCLGTLDSTSAYLGAILSSKITTKKHNTHTRAHAHPLAHAHTHTHKKKVKKKALNRPQRDTYFQFKNWIKEAPQVGMLMCSGNSHFFTSPSVPTNDHENMASFGKYIY